MKKILLICLLVYTTQAIAQKQTLNVDSLIKNKSFVFIATYVKTVMPQKDVTPFYTPPPINDNVNLAGATIGQRYTIQNTPFTAPDIAGGMKIRLAKDIDQNYNKPKSITKYEQELASKDKALYFIQGNDQITVSDLLTPKSIDAIKDGDFYKVKASGYELKSVKKKNGKWNLIYSLKDKDRYDNFYITINQDGSAEFAKDAYASVKGYIVSST